MLEQTPTPPNKKQLRKTFLKQRRSLSVQDWQIRSHTLCQRLKRLPLFQEANTVLAYTSFRQEPDLTPLFKTSEKQWGLPRCVDKSLIWHRWKTTDGLESGAYGIFEPSASLPTLQGQEVDLILVPAVACDEQGYRLGYGGGFYDRLLATPDWSNIPTIGIVFDFALVPQLPKEAWDQPLQGVCTDQTVLDFANPI
ncbi:5-formyltetrahydrofolate cyclo-ligase [Spirulina sp. CS-785/01]|uniref:5-formyltetrahydrofolate cyclo-ligase n=1 Tax=Spirulina sp. CS-785/01 TaxID=3021716 RepID=UPI00232B1D12|nr:5-formyltetrahydrofolate cyclo-ligase [Spirulina sp. CS-785/01]MDB9311924.1 5-formyltetrahydrofolate cyclo-ligase [Spirulina sp. CS-785/01]